MNPSPKISAATTQTSSNHRKPPRPTATGALGRRHLPPNTVLKISKQFFFSPKPISELISLKNPL
ncbi:hypothetical protein COLO4_25561 [Corchorus olitorius]|uniref:Uncharacterized protein n=1 Tax=Corchorus olitorius TaxID=93759 RepID=A0A1R3I1I6_9ROSI|nr:hypothetical protein COLO4_25561 [Corchorus olitorius]